MNKNCLLDKLKSLNVDIKYYSLGYEIKDNAYDIEKLSNNKFAVYYLERNEKVGLKIFETEIEALDHLIKSLSFNIKNGIDLST